MNQLSPLAYYQQQVEETTKQLLELRKKKNLLGWLRLFCIVFALIIGFALLPEHITAAIVSVVICVAVFIYVVSIDINNSASIEQAQRHLQINENEISYAHHQYAQFEEGKQFEPAEHAYAADIDIFGKHSLFQYINRCESEQGKALLAHQLLNASTATQVAEIQSAVKELAPQVQWRQLFQNHGKSSSITKATEQRITNWLRAPEKFFGHPAMRWILLLYPVIPLTVVFLYAYDLIAFNRFSLVMVLLLLLSSSFTSKINLLHSYVSRIAEEINTLQLQLSQVADQQFQSSALLQLQEMVKNEKKTAHHELRKLKKILDRFDFRLNIVVIPVLNTFLLWDIRQAAALQQWKTQNDIAVGKWFECIAGMEVMNTLATLSYNHTQWIFPLMVPEYFHLSAKDLGHPLIAADKRVDNSCNIDGQGQIMLITGSNMAGKSTFLRSLGVNTVLAMMGAPVCATQFSITPVTLISSMRIADNLAENTSTFYAELKKLQRIIERVNKHEQLFILLDEILRGTNSLDRHTGSVALLKQMVQEKSVAVIATHDIALSELEKNYPGAVHNYHFDVQVKGEDLFFDYRLKDGVCTSMNASILMKKIGIHMEEAVDKE